MTTKRTPPTDTFTLFVVDALDRTGRMRERYYYETEASADLAVKELRERTHFRPRKSTHEVSPDVAVLGPKAAAKALTVLSMQYIVDMQEAYPLEAPPRQEAPTLSERVRQEAPLLSERARQVAYTEVCYTLQLWPNGVRPVLVFGPRAFRSAEIERILAWLRYQLTPMDHEPSAAASAGPEDPRCRR